MIKEQKSKNATQRSMAQNSMSVTDDAKHKLEEDIKQLEDNKLLQEKKYKHQVTKLDQQLRQLGHELQILSVKLKEKDQEVKLNELKIKELRKQVPNTKLRPINDNASNGGSRKDQKSNDERGPFGGEQESMISE